MKLDGAVALVTGGASGLGAATVRRLIAGGARAVIVGRDDAKGEPLAAELEGRAIYAKADVTDAAQVEATAARAAELGPLRIGPASKVRARGLERPIAVRFDPEGKSSRGLFDAVGLRDSAGTS